MAKLSDNKFNESYVAEETASLGYKVFSTVKSKHQHLYPISFRMINTPGSMIRTLRATDHYFSFCQVVLIVFDISSTIEEPKVEQWT